MPNAHLRRPCPCPGCLSPGEYGVAKLRSRSTDYNRDGITPRQEVLAKLAVADYVPEIITLLESLRGRRQGDVFRVAHLADHPDPAVREVLAYALQGFHPKAAAEFLEKLRNDPVEEVREAAEP